MSRKTLNENVIVNELKGSSVFFPKSSDSPTSVENKPPENVAEAVEATANTPQAGVPVESSVPTIEETSPREKKNSLNPESNHASALASYQPSMINEIRKSIKALGKEVSYIRLTPEEKNRLVDIVYTYRRQGVRTSENEIHRIALNFLLSDFKANGKSSVLSKVIEALLA